MIRKILNNKLAYLLLSPLNTCSKIWKFSSVSQQSKAQGRRSSKKDPISLQSLILPFPFQYTVKPSTFKYYDPRFNQQPIRKNLQMGEKQHIKFVMQNFQQFLNGKIKLDNKNQAFIYLHPLLKSKVNTFLEQNKHAAIQVKFRFQMDNFNKSDGYFQMQEKKTQKSLPTDYKNKQDDAKKLSNPQKFMHEFSFERQKQLLFFVEKNKMQKKSQQQLLKADLKQMLQQKTQKKQVREMMQDVSKPKQSDSNRAANYLLIKLKSLGSKKPQTVKLHQDIYLISDLIKGNFNCQLFYKGELMTNENVDLVTKWLYVVQGSEAEPVRKSRKRIIYDFQFWNRGTFFPLKNFVEDI